MLKKILLSALGLVVLGVVVLSVAASRQPDTFRIERRARVAAPPAAVFAHLEDFRRWSAWSPWEKLDPAMERTFEGAPSGVGAVYTWRGNNEAGSGRMTILESRPGELLEIRLEFTEPWEATNRTLFTLVPQETGTEVTWTMEGDNTFLGKIFSLFVNMDELVGADFEKGLANLAAVAQAGATTAQN